MFILGGVCIFLSIVLGIMGLMAWGAMTTEPPTDNDDNVVTDGNFDNEVNKDSSEDSSSE